MSFLELTSVSTFTPLIKIALETTSPWRLQLSHTLHVIVKMKRHRTGPYYYKQYGEHLLQNALHPVTVDKRRLLTVYNLTEAIYRWWVTNSPRVTHGCSSWSPCHSHSMCTLCFPMYIHFFVLHRLAHWSLPHVVFVYRTTNTCNKVHLKNKTTCKLLNLQTIAQVQR